jgi:hypothetical protein
MTIEPWIWLATARSGLVRADQVVSIRSGRNASTGGGADRQFGVFIETVNASGNVPETALVFTEDEEAADVVLRAVLGVLAEARAAERGGIVQFNPVTLVNIEAATALGREPSKYRNR